MPTGPGKTGLKRPVLLLFTMWGFFPSFYITTKMLVDKYLCKCYMPELAIKDI
jgi:hypothetical protein